MRVLTVVACWCIVRCASGCSQISTCVVDYVLLLEIVLVFAVLKDCGFESDRLSGAPQGP
jgi:hypothetical protein